jgi:DNA-binding NarL/FixJ family response regulator
MVTQVGTGGEEPFVLVPVDLPQAFVNQIRLWEEFRVVSYNRDTPQFNLGSQHRRSLILISERLASAEPRRVFARFKGLGSLTTLLVLLGGQAAVSDEELLESGYSGVLRLDTPPAELRRALHAVLNGELWFSRMVLSIATRMRLSPKCFSPREREIARFIAQGLTNQQIADRLFICRETVRWHVRRLNDKTGKPARKRLPAHAGSEHVKASPLAERQSVTADAESGVTAIEAELNRPTSMTFLADDRVFPLENAT